MSKLVTKKIRKIIHNHVSLNGKILNFIFKTMVFDDSECCMCEQERYQKNIKNETTIHPKIDEKMIQKSFSKKGYPKDGKPSKND